MGFHTFPIERAEALEDPARYRYCSREELVAMLDPDEASVVADLGSGTGFYSDDVAPFVDTLYAVDVQEAMHDQYREKGAPENVEFVTAEISSLPFDDDHLDAAFSTVTHHEYASSAGSSSADDVSGDATVNELARVVRPDGRLVVVDWSADGDGESGPPVEERFALDEVVDQFETAGFAVDVAQARPETFAVAARNR